jgi:two-component system, chemotaxis family, response regulator Rcp1
VYVNSDEPGRSIEIMLVEDSLIDARITIESLKACGYHHRLTLFLDSAEAFDFLRREGIFAKAPKPDIILLDLLLPDSDGISFLTTLRSHPELNQIPVVVLTSSADNSDRQACEQLGISSYIVKPFNEDKFLTVIRQLKSLTLALEAAAYCRNVENSPSAQSEAPRQC